MIENFEGWKAMKENETSNSYIILPPKAKTVWDEVAKTFSDIQRINEWELIEDRNEGFAPYLLHLMTDTTGSDDTDYMVAYFTEDFYEEGFDSYQGNWELKGPGFVIASITSGVGSNDLVLNSTMDPKVLIETIKEILAEMGDPALKDL